MTAITTTCWLVIRNYHGKRRVLSIESSQSEAMTAYNKAVADLRDGDVLLVKAHLETPLLGASGGYNRTRW